MTALLYRTHVNTIIRSKDGMTGVGTARGQKGGPSDANQHPRRLTVSFADSLCYRADAFAITAFPQQIPQTFPLPLSSCRYASIPGWRRDGFRVLPAA